MVALDFYEDYLHLCCVVSSIYEIAKEADSVRVATFLLGAVWVQLFWKFFDLFVLEGSQEDPKLCVTVDIHLFVDADLS